MQFGDGSLLSLVVAAAVALLLAVWTWRWRRTLRARLRRRGGSEARDGSALVQRSRSRSILRVLLVAAALALLGIAVARPQFGDRTTEIRQEGVAVVIALDVSLSMAAEDQTPNRLAVAQAEIGGLLDRLRGDRVGLVIFAGDAFIRFPLTRDAVAARDIVNALEPGEALVRPGTDVAAAIDAARALLATSDAATNVILIVSDGESLQGDALLAAREAANRDLRVFTAGVGTEAGSTIPVADRFSRETTVKLDARTGLPVITRLDAPALASLAEAGRGRFVRLDRPGAL
ncbi:MAG: VWA domain-containing protein, partial [Dehalococcoidia bacterium]